MSLSDPKMSTKGGGKTMLQNLDYHPEPQLEGS